MSIEAYYAAEKAFDAACDRCEESSMVTACIIEDTLNLQFLEQGIALEARTLQGDGIVCIIVGQPGWNRHPEDFRYMTAEEWALANAALTEAAQ
jgi:hypothetical protein